MSEAVKAKKEFVLSDVKPSKAIVQMAVPAIIALLAKAVYNIVDTAYISMLNSEETLAAVGVILPILLIFISIESIFSAGAGVLAGRQLGANDKEGANVTVSTITTVSIIIGIALCLAGIIFMEPLLRIFGASDAVMPYAKDYAFWMFISAMANLPAQNLNCAARAESSAKISSVAVGLGAIINIILDPIFMFEFGLGMGVKGASLATTISQFITLFILIWFYGSKRSIIKVHPRFIKPSAELLKTVILIGVPSAVIQICLAVSGTLTNMAAAALPDGDLIIAVYGIIQRLILIGCYTVIGFMQGYQAVASYSFGAKNKERFKESVRFTLKTSLCLSLAFAVLYMILSRPLIALFNNNPAIVEYGSRLLISQVALYPAFGLCYMMTITFQTIGASRYGVFLSTIRQGIFYAPFILVLPRFLGITGIYFAQPAADVLTLLVCILSYKSMNRIAMQNLEADKPQGKKGQDKNLSPSHSV